MTPEDVGLVWFRRDLRLDDNPAWAAATAACRRVVALYVLDDRLCAAAGPARRRQHLAEVRALDRTLCDHGGRLLVRGGDPRRIVPAETARAGATSVHWNADVTPYARGRDEAVARALDGDARAWWGGLVLPPGSVSTDQARVPRVFTAFWRRWRAATWDPWPDPGDAAVAADPGDGLPELDGEPPRPAGEEAAQEILHRFVDDGLSRYADDRDDVGHPSTSGLSVALRFGTLSPRRVVEAVGDAAGAGEAFVRQVAWRDWFAHLLHETPSLVDEPLRAQTEIDWREDDGDLAAWREGRTGFPLVDAGMRELAATGGMHGRVRMVTASFLVKDLLVDWRAGERHFRRCLLDGDVAQNVGNWQWVAGTGPDAAPYVRVFNPVTQSRTHDPSGRYLRRWLPELAALDDAAIHAPWEAGPLDLAAAGVTLGETYPEPIVDHAEARQRALAAHHAARTARAAR